MRPGNSGQSSEEFGCSSRYVMNPSVTTKQQQMARKSCNNTAEAPKPLLSKMAAVEVSEEEVKKLSRGISRTAENACIIDQVRTELRATFSELDEIGIQGSPQSFSPIETHDYIFTLPSFSSFSDEFRGFVEHELIDTSVLISLEEAGRLNWWTCLGEGCQKLYPLSTTGDGNCLLHAASLGMWGLHDRLLTLRKALHYFLTTSVSRHALWRRWRWQIARSNAQNGLNLVLNEDEWNHEWVNVLRLASSQPRSSGSSTPNLCDVEANASEDRVRTYESLEEIHVLALAHVLKRPIVVIADTFLKDVHGEALAPITFGGIYLPLEIPASECSRSPLVLAYDSAHFSALVATKPINLTSESPSVLPLMDSEHELLPIQFEVDPGESCVWNRDELNESVVSRLVLTHEDRVALLNQYLDLVDVACPSVVKKTKVGSRPPHPIVRMNNLEDWNTDAEFRQKTSKQLHSVAKQFGSLGRSMGRKLKKNLLDNFTLKGNGSAAPLRLNNGQWESPEFILCSRLHTERHNSCADRMIDNYIQAARQRYDQQQSEKQKQTLVWQRRNQHALAETALQEGPSPCINPNCAMYGTALTSYMCTACYAKQKQEEERARKNVKSNGSPIYGTGKSVFYAEADNAAHEGAACLPSRKPPSKQLNNGTLYLSNSTFYVDEKPHKTVDGSNKGSQQATPPTSDKNCRAGRCTMKGNASLDGMCSHCFSQRMEGTLARDAILERMRAEQLQ